MRRDGKCVGKAAGGVRVCTGREEVWMPDGSRVSVNAIPCALRVTPFDCGIHMCLLTHL